MLSQDYLIKWCRLKLYQEQASELGGENTVELGEVMSDMLFFPAYTN